MSDDGKVIIPLKLVPAKSEEDSDRDQRLERFDELVKVMREWLAENGDSGFALVAYSRSIDQGVNHITTWTNCYVNDPADCFWLPDAVKTRVYNRLHDDEN